MEELPRAQRPDHPDEFQAWVLEVPGAGPRAQSPVDQLLAEHHLMEVVLRAMESEAERVARGSDLKVGFWKDVVRFLVEFTQDLHRAKEEEVFYPAVIRMGLMDRARTDRVEDEHAGARKMTLGILDGVNSGDWEKVVRLASAYAYFIRNHMLAEESDLLTPAIRGMDAESQADLCAAYHEIESASEKGRQTFLDLARRIQAATVV